jgi:23S rRNA (cytosine1962-C5)-methyltransferase
MTKVYLNKKINPRIALGHPWIYNNEVDRIAGPIEPGDIVEVYFFDGQLAGRGYINPNSQIIIRLLTRKREEIDAPFFYEKIKTAWAYRQQLGYTENCRLVFGEADGLPALIIDKFNDYFVLQTLSLGIDIWKPAIVEALQKIFSPKGIYERNDVPVRELEGLTQVKDFLTDPFPTEIIIKENDLQFYVNIETGQKTGYFLDQQDNRRAIKEIVKGADV